MENTLTWGALRAFVNELPETYDNAPVSWIGEERGGNVTAAFRFEEDYTSMSGEGLEPVSVYKEAAEHEHATQDDKDYYESALEDISYHIGFPALGVDSIKQL